LTYCQRYF